jgi:hypothetical protein
MVEADDFGDTLDSLATFGASIANTIVTAERGGTVMPTVVPRTNIPQGSASVIQPSRKSTGINMTEVVLLLAAGIGIAFGVRALAKA